MDPAPAPALSLTRLARLHAQVFLTLVWFVGALWRRLSSGGALNARALRRDLDALARGVGLLAFLHAVSRLPDPAPRSHRYGRRRNAGFARAAVGARVRRVMRGRTWAQRLFAILAFVRDIASHAARLTRRVRNGLSRRRVILPKRDGAPCAPWLSAPAAEPNTS